MRLNAFAVVLLLCLLAGGAAPVLAQSLSDADRFFGLEWENGERRVDVTLLPFLV